MQMKKDKWPNPPPLWEAEAEPNGVEVAVVALLALLIFLLWM